MSRTRIAVLGAGGFIGSHLVPALLQRFDWDIDAVDRDLTKLDCRDPRVRRVQARIEAPGLVEELTERCQVVISLTALCNPAQYSTIPLEVIEASFTHLLPLVKRCAERAVRLIHFSSAEVYGRRALDAQGQPTARMHEDDSCFLLGPVSRERWTYSCAKQLLERVIWAHGQHGELPFTIIRPFNTIGARMDFLPGVDGEGTPRVLACFMNALLRGQPLPLVGGGAQRRAFMDVSDMNEAVCRVLERPARSNGQIFNIGNPHNEVGIAELARLLAGCFAKLLPDRPPAEYEFVSAEEFYGPGYDDTQERMPDVRKAEQLLDWRPRRGLAAALPPIVRDYCERYGARVVPALPMSRFQMASSA